MNHKFINNENVNILPFISIVIPAKNEGNYLKICLKFLYRSIHEWVGNSEIILVDNGSEDDTEAIAKANSCRIIEQKIGTIGAIRNLGAKNAQGNILAFLDADCLVASDWISCCIQNFANPNIAIVGTRVVPDFKSATWVGKAWFKLVPGSERPDFVNWLGTSNLFIRKDVFFDVGGFDEKLETGEDVNLCYKIGEKHLIYLEKRIDTIHLRESKTISELFRRECWRGKNTLKSFAQNKFARKEFMSVAVPAVNLVAMVFFIILGMIQSKYAISPAIIVLSFPVLLMFMKRIKVDFSTEIFQIYIVASVYLFARSCSILNEVFYFFKPHCTRFKRVN